MSNLDAAEALLAGYILGQMPSLVQHVRCHLVPGDSRREEFELVARRPGVNVLAPTQTVDQPQYEERKKIVVQERGQIVTAMRAASSASLREQVRVRKVSLLIPRRRPTPSHDFVTEPGFHLGFGNQSHCPSPDLGVVLLGMIASFPTRNDAAAEPGVHLCLSSR